MASTLRCSLVGLVMVTLSACAPSPAPVPPPAPDTYAAMTLQVTLAESTEPLAGAEVSARFFESSMTAPMLGRGFIAEDFRADGRNVAMLSHALWESRLGSDPSIIGHAITVNDQPVTVLGVFPKGFDIPAGAQVWIPKPPMVQ